MTTTALTTADLKRAFRRCGLWRIGWTYDRAIGVPLVAWGLQKSALAARRTTPDAPQQLDLMETAP